jgi:hypothetical protein
MKYWKVQYELGHEVFEVVLMRKGDAFSVLTDLRAKYANVQVIGPKEELDRHLGVSGDLVSFSAPKARKPVKR